MLWRGALLGPKPFSLSRSGYFLAIPSAFAEEKRPIVYVAPIEGVIDLGLAPFVQRVLDEATLAGAAAVILEVNTFGGRVDAAVLIRDALLNSKLRTIAFVNKRAISAGALISLAAEHLVMAEGGTIGAAIRIAHPAPAACTECGKKSVQPVDATVELVRLAGQQDCPIEIVDHCDPLMALGGIGCLLRY
jgi:membrane-bound ClpP family serine protease